MIRLRRFPTVAVGAFALLAAAACGSSSEPGDDAESQAFLKLTGKEIFDEGIAAMKVVDSLRMDGSLTNKGQQVELHLALDTDGNCDGSMTIEGGTAELISNDEGQFIKGDDAFWASAVGSEEGGQQMANLIGDRWVAAPAEAGLGDVCDLDDLLDQMDSSEDAEVEIEKGEITEIDGVSAVELLRDEPEGAKRLWVATAGDHYVLKFDAEGDDPGVMELSEFNETVDPESPTGDDLVDMSSLG